MAETSNYPPQQEWHWCDTCQEHFYGRAAWLHHIREECEADRSPGWEES